MSIINSLHTLHVQTILQNGKYTDTNITAIKKKLINMCE